ncbi:MAG: TetR/AcrR family transcriptional regulator C-terminal domain-containing protein [Acidimicrobiales bacterium]
MPRSPVANGTQPERRAGRRGLTPEDILRAAMEMADEDGIATLSMRGLGKRLGVQAMSLYNHVKNKEDLLDGLVDLVIGEIELPSPDERWEIGIRQCALSAYQVLLQHPWACSLVMMPPSGGGRTSRMRYIEALLRQFREAGFSAELTYRAYHAVDSHVLGFTMWELGHSLAADIDPEVMGELVAIVSTGDYPHLLEHSQQHFSDRAGLQGEFEFGLDLVLEGLNRLHENETSSKRTVRRRTKPATGLPPHSTSS